MCGCCSRKEEEGNDSSVRVTVAGEGGGYGVSVRSAQWWLRLRAREAAAEATLADGRSKGERRGLCAGGAATEEEGSGDVKRWWVATGRQMRQAAVKKAGWKWLRQMGAIAIDARVAATVWLKHGCAPTKWGCRRQMGAATGTKGEEQRCWWQMREKRKTAQRACGCCNKKGGKDEGDDDDDDDGDGDDDDDGDGDDDDDGDGDTTTMTRGATAESQQERRGSLL
ncbi:hypothetical protein GW17_00053064 [Ensete ventricosum]|nr:hypothetical protein GW17_00053064 [Ensete ventricosum]